MNALLKSRKYFGFVSMYSSGFFFFAPSKMNEAAGLSTENAHLLLPSLLFSCHKSCTRSNSRILFSVSYFPAFGQQ